MAKKKMITLKKPNEVIEFDSLTERERLIYQAGQNSEELLYCAIILLCFICGICLGIQHHL